MQTLLIVGSGDVARRTLPHLLGRYRVFALLRDSSQAPFWRGKGVRPLIADLDRPSTLKCLAGLADIVLHFAPPPERGSEDSRMRRLLASLCRGKSLPQRFVYISTSGVYGDCSGELVAETRSVHPVTARARRRVDAEHRLRRFGCSSGVCVSILRAPGIYAADRLPVERLQKRTPVLCAEDDVYTNHIHADDLARACLAALWRGWPQRVYNVNDDTCLKMGDYFDLAADLYGLPPPPRVTREQANAQLPAMQLSFMGESRRMDNTRMKRELRLRLRYPTVVQGLMPLAGA